MEKMNFLITVGGVEYRIFLIYSYSDSRVSQYTGLTCKGKCISIADENEIIQQIRYEHSDYIMSLVYGKIASRAGLTAEQRGERMPGLGDGVRNFGGKLD